MLNLMTLGSEGEGLHVEGIGQNVDGIILRLNSDGTLDTSFSSDGIQVKQQNCV